MGVKQIASRCKQAENLRVLVDAGIMVDDAYSLVSFFDIFSKKSKKRCNTKGQIKSQ